MFTRSLINILNGHKSNFPELYKLSVYTEFLITGVIFLRSAFVIKIKVRMVITKNGSVVYPNIKETMVSTQPLRTITRRAAELPSLRYGNVGAHTSLSGPLRVSHYDTMPSQKYPIKRTSTKTYPIEEISIKPIKPPRRVRFDLRTSDAPTGATGAYTESVVKQTAGEDGALRTRAPLSQHSDSIISLLEGQQIDLRTVQDRRTDLNSGISVPVTPSPGIRTRIHPTARYIRGTLSPTSNSAALAAVTPGGQALVQAARDGDDTTLRDILRRAVLVGIPEADVNATDNSGRTAVSYVASNGSVETLEQILQLPALDSNRPDNEGNTPLHFAAQAGQVECLNYMLSRCKGIEIDARNNLGFTPLMKAALQGRNKCAKLLLFAGANPTLRDSGRGLRADQWARFCGRYICADVIEKHARQRLLERSTSYGNWGGDNEMGTRVVLGKVVPVPQIPPQPQGLRSKLRKVFRTSSSPSHNADSVSSARLITQLTTAALCASTPVLPSAPSVPPVVKSLIRPLTVPRLQITLANNNDDCTNTSLNGVNKSAICSEEKPPIVKPTRTKKKK